jgi:branched-chain amino acid transport system substrate-binding protein
MTFIRLMVEKGGPEMTYAKTTFFAAALTTATALVPLSAGAQEGPVKIGVINDQSSIYADLSGPGGVEAARMAIEDFGGQVLGKKIELVFADHQNKPDVATSIVNKWLDVDNVDLVSDLPNSSAMLAVQEILRQKKKALVIVSTGATSDFTGSKCSPYGMHWTYDTFALANSTGRTLVQEGGDTWFFLTADYAFGHALERDVSNFVKAAGGKVVGAVRHPFPNQDFSSFLLQAQASKAKIIGMANAGGDTINTIKQAAEFGIVKGGQKLAGLLIFISDVHSLGLKAAQGIVLTTGFYWDRDEETRKWSKRFFERRKAMPTMTHGGVYSSITHYLKAVKAAGTKDPLKVAAKMREMPVRDFFAPDGKVREDGRMTHEMYLVQVKTPEESKYPWDYYKILRKIPGDQAFRPLADGNCPHVKK